MLSHVFALRWMKGAALGTLLLGCGGSAVEPAAEGDAGSGGSGGTTDDAGTGGAGGTGGSGGIGGSGGLGGSGGVGGAGGTPQQSGDCGDDIEDVCPDNGSVCTEIVPGGFRVCALEAREATECLHPEFDECCTTSQCPDNTQCFPHPTIPYCGGPQPVEMNLCASDLCAADADCGGPSSFCVPRGVFGNAVRYCSTLRCRHDSDCTEEAGGICAPVQEPCCGSGAGLFCVYPSAGCRSNFDCPSGFFCDIDYAKGIPMCQQGGPLCPA